MILCGSWIAILLSKESEYILGSLNTQTFTILKSVPLVWWPTEEIPITLLISLNCGLGQGENELGIVMLVDLTHLLRLAQTSIQLAGLNRREKSVTFLRY